MATANRRTFIKQAAAATALAGAGPAVHAKTAERSIKIGLIGCGGRGVYDARLMADVPGVQIQYVCDPDAARLENARKEFGLEASAASDDMRKILDDPGMDAVIVATPVHWHVPASILACQAGKHVYVEKPCSHNIREGRLLVEAARQHDRVVQHGTQVRSTKMMIDAVKLLRDGIIGTILSARCWNIQRRGDIGHAMPSEPPAEVDYDMWVGPAPMIPFQRNRFHGGWNWWYHFGAGDMGNDGVHDLEYCRWGLGVETHPTSIMAVGGKYFFDDDQQFPDTQTVVFEYPGDGRPGSQRILTYEQRLWSRNYPYNVDSGAEYYGTEGQMFLSRRGKFQVLDARNKRVEVPLAREAQNTESHVANFVEAVRNGGRANADIQIGHLTTTLCHLGNLAVRLGRSLKFDPANEQFTGDAEANGLLTREYRPAHWAVPPGIEG